MAYFIKEELEARAHTVHIKDLRNSRMICFGEETLKNFSKVDSNKKYDIFLSHSYKDKKAVAGLLDLLSKKYNYTIYVDWIEDKALNRECVNRKTAQRLRERMRNCRCLLYATSDNATYSKWMPWEVGLMDGINGKVAICPFVSASDPSFNGQEYLNIYPTLDEKYIQNTMKKCLWINDKNGEYVKFDSWLNDATPYNHIL